MTNLHNHGGKFYLPSLSKRLLFFFCRHLRFFALAACTGLVLAIVFSNAHISLYHPLIHQAVSNAGNDTMPPPDEFMMRVTLYVFYLVFLFILILVILALIAGSSFTGRWQKYFSTKKLVTVFSIYSKKWVFICKQFSPKKRWLVNTTMVKQL